MASTSVKFQMIIHKLFFAVCAISLIYKYYYIKPKVVIIPLSARSGIPHRINVNTFSLLGPYNVTNTPVEDTYDQLIDVKNFSFIVNPPVCQDYPAGLLLMVIVSSNPKNFENRMVIRSTWGQNTDTMKVVFLIGETDNSAVGDKISEEIELFGDMVQGTFIDAYRNMTYKHVMGLKWVYHHCPRAKYVLKTDDDVLVHSLEMSHFLVRELSPWGSRDLIACHIIKKALVKRSKSKWTMSMKEYPDKYYPDYCAGWAILYSQDVVARLLKVAQNDPYFWIDDVYLTGIAAKKIGVVGTSLSNFVVNLKQINNLIKAGSNFTSDHPLLIGPYDLKVPKMKEFYKIVQQG